jgi:hypothetical protein
MVQTLKRIATIILYFAIGLIVLGLMGNFLLHSATTLDPVQGLQVGKNLVQFFVPGKGWFVDANTATLVTKDKLQSNGCQFLTSANGTTNYTYAMGTACQVVTAYTRGMRFWLVTDVPCAANCSLSIDNVVPQGTSIKRSDGKTDPGGLFDFTQGVPIWFDGTVFRIEWQR